MGKFTSLDRKIDFYLLASSSVFIQLVTTFPCFHISWDNLFEVYVMASLNHSDKQLKNVLKIQNETISQNQVVNTRFGLFEIATNMQLLVIFSSCFKVIVKAHQS